MMSIEERIDYYRNGNVRTRILEFLGGRLAGKPDLLQGLFILEMAGAADPNVTMTNARRGRCYLREVARHLALQNK